MDVDHDHDHGYGSHLVRMEAADVAFGFRPRDVPERLIYDDESTPEEISIDDESRWIQKQLEPLFGPLSSNDISRFLYMHHVQKLDIPFIAMYGKDDCLSLLKDPEQPEEEKSKVKWYRILLAAQELHKKWLLFQNQKRALRFYYTKRFEEESRLGLIHDLMGGRPKPKFYTPTGIPRCYGTGAVHWLRLIQKLERMALVVRLVGSTSGSS